MNMMIQQITGSNGRVEQLFDTYFRYRELIEQIPAATYISLLAEASKRIYTSPQIERLSGYDADDWLRETSLWPRLLHPDDRDRVLDELYHCQTSGEPFRSEYRFLDREERMIWVHDEALVVRGRYGEADYLQGLMWDITEHKQAELAQQASEAKLRAIFAAMTDVILVLDEQGRYLEIAPTNPALLYRPAQNLFGRTLHEIFPSEQAEAFLGHIRYALEHNETVLTEYTLQLDNQEHCFSAAISPMSDNKIVWVARDITERRCTEKTLEAIAIEKASLFDELQRTNIELTFAYEATIEGWSMMLDLRDKETEGHTQRVTERTIRLAKAVGLKDEELMHVRRGALLHDIGKMGVPDAILLKAGKLTYEERTLMQQHPKYAYDMLSRISYLEPALDIPYCHHEKWDGTGYPRGLQGENIPLSARLFALVDVYDALTSDRPYRIAWSEKDTVQYIRQQSGKHFDPKVVDMFLDTFGKN